MSINKTESWIHSGLEIVFAGGGAGGGGREIKSDVAEIQDSDLDGRQKKEG